MAKQKVAMLTAGGLAPCLSSAVGGLIERYSDIAPEIDIIAYRSGYQGVLLGDRIEINKDMREKAHLLHRYGGSPIGNSRVKLTNAADCAKRGLVKEGDNPLRVAADRLAADGITILHTIGGDDTNTTAADLAAYLGANGYNLTVVGLPKTVDNDVVPIKQSLGAWTAAEVGASFFDNVSNEQSAAPKTFVIHEVMGRHCGWLTAATARAYIQKTSGNEYVEGLMMNTQMKNIDGIYLPEMAFDIEAEAERLKEIMDKTAMSRCSCRKAPALIRSLPNAKRPERPSSATPSATSRSTRSMLAAGSRSSSPASSARNAPWYRNRVTSPAPPPPMGTICASSRAWSISPSKARSTRSLASPAMTKTRMANCGRSSFRVSRAESISTSLQNGLPK